MYKREPLKQEENFVVHTELAVSVGVSEFGLKTYTPTETGGELRGGYRQLRGPRGRLPQVLLQQGSPPFLCCPQV